MENITSQPEKLEKPQGLEEPKKEPKKKGWLVFLILGILGMLGGGGMVAVVFLTPEETLPEIIFPTIPSASTETNDNYSNLTGLPLADGVSKTAPAFCIQTPNGNDGARPQSGLTEAGVVFEAIAEAGITRFAAIYQNANAAVIGPIRSLRIYYLTWDTPFDCTIVHAGGAPDALDAVASGGYKDMSENYAYMYRGAYGYRRWNNLFTTAQYLRQFSDDYGYTSSNINGFSRMTPEESKRARIDSTVLEKLSITEPATQSTSATSPRTTGIGVYFGSSPTFNVEYRYNADSNTYDRWYTNGEPHEVYKCPSEDYGEPNPEDTCELTVMSPAVVVAMMVEEHRADDGYHEDIATVGSGEVHIFQNGIAINGTWNKGSWNDQIKFYDDSGNEIKLAPGQTFVEAVPLYGGVEY